MLRKKFPKVSLLILVLLITLLPTQTLFASSATSYVTNATQEKSNWCWAACISSILQGSESQSTIVSYLMGPSLPNFTATGGQIRYTLNHFNNCTYTERPYTTLNYQSIKNNIDYGKPIIATIIGQNNSEGHAIVIYGYADNGSNPTIYYMDPYYGSKSSLTLNQLLYGFQKSYNGTTQNFVWIETVSFYGN